MRDTILSCKSKLGHVSYSEKRYANGIFQCSLVTQLNKNSIITIQLVIMNEVHKSSNLFKRFPPCIPKNLPKRPTKIFKIFRQMKIAVENHSTGAY